ncbi:Cytosine/adenosine deaminase [Blastococcus sp. DSM 46786]|nr:Cytosine/adenosine deaminase [Blastococcus sp. DSM 46786]
MDGRPDDGQVADVLVEGGRVRTVSAEPLPVDGAAVIEGTGRILLPGFVDGHRHVWQTALRGLAGDWSLFEYLVHVRNVYSPRYTAADVHAGSYAGYLEALDAGITTVVDFSHAMRAPGHADAVVDAMQSSGIRGVLAYGMSHVPEPGENPLRAQVESTWRHDDVRRLRGGPLASDDGRVLLGLATADLGEFLPLQIVRRDLDLGRELGLRRITIHASHGAATRHARLVRRLHRAGLLGTDLLFAHGTGWSTDELRYLADSGAGVVSTPESELQMGMGLPVLARAQARGIPVGLGADVVSGNGGDLFAQMRLALQATRFSDNEQLARSGRVPAHLTLRAVDVLRAATVDGARAVGLGEVTGSITPGRAADLVLIRADGLATAPVNDAVGTVVLQATPATVETVLVGGEVVKRDGRLVGVDRQAAVAAVEKSRDRLLADVDPAAVAALERAFAATMPLDRTGAAMSRLAGAMLQHESTARRLLRTMQASFDRTRPE